jgi:hypothetical protein
LKLKCNVPMAELSFEDVYCCFLFFDHCKPRLDGLYPL